MKIKEGMLREWLGICRVISDVGVQSGNNQDARTSLFPRNVSTLFLRSKRADAEGEAGGPWHVAVQPPQLFPSILIHLPSSDSFSTSPG
jgi:hypothetical protein